MHITKLNKEMNNVLRLPSTTGVGCRKSMEKQHNESGKNN